MSSWKDGSDIDLLLPLLLQGEMMAIRWPEAAALFFSSSED